MPEKIQKKFFVFQVMISELLASLLSKIILLIGIEYINKQS